MEIYKPPAPVPTHMRGIFLAGSIEMGTAEDWQTTVTSWFENTDQIIFNPRRDDWDSSWEQSIHNPQFKEQVEWELNALDLATTIIMYFSPGTKSPISLLELGLYAKGGCLLVCCPHGFWRRGNVEIVCQRYGIPLFESLDDLQEFLYTRANL
jgi:hypothetical protein